MAGRGESVVQDFESRGPIGSILGAAGGLHFTPRCGNRQHTKGLSFSYYAYVVWELKEPLPR